MKNLNILILTICSGLLLLPGRVAGQFSETVSTGSSVQDMPRRITKNSSGDYAVVGVQQNGTVKSLEAYTFSSSTISNLGIFNTSCSSGGNVTNSSINAFASGYLIGSVVAAGGNSYASILSVNSSLGSPTSFLFPYNTTSSTNFYTEVYDAGSSAFHVMGGGSFSSSTLSTITGKLYSMDVSSSGNITSLSEYYIKDGFGYYDVDVIKTFMDASGNYYYVGNCNYNNSSIGIVLYVNNTASPVTTKAQLFNYKFSSADFNTSTGKIIVAGATGSPGFIVSEIDPTGGSVSKFYSYADYGDGLISSVSIRYSGSDFIVRGSAPYIHGGGQIYDCFYLSDNITSTTSPLLSAFRYATIDQDETVYDALDDNIIGATLVSSYEKGFIDNLNNSCNLLRMPFKMGTSSEFVKNMDVDINSPSTVPSKSSLALSACTGYLTTTNSYYHCKTSSSQTITEGLGNVYCTNRAFTLQTNALPSDIKGVTWFKNGHEVSADGVSVKADKSGFSEITPYFGTYYDAMVQYSNGNYAELGGGSTIGGLLISGEYGPEVTFPTNSVTYCYSNAVGASNIVHAYVTGVGTVKYSILLDNASLTGSTPVSLTLGGAGATIDITLPNNLTGGGHSISFTVSNASGLACTETEFFDFTVPGPDFKPLGAFCLDGTTKQFTYSGTNQDLPDRQTYYWEYSPQGANNYTFLSTDANPVFSGKIGAGAWDVRLTIVQKGCDPSLKFSVVHTIYINTPIEDPSFTYTKSGTTLNFTAVTPTVVAPNPGSIQYDWTFYDVNGPKTTASGQTASVNFLGSGYARVDLKETLDGACSKTITKYLCIGNDVQASISGDTLVCLCDALPASSCPVVTIHGENSTGYDPAGPTGNDPPVGLQWSVDGTPYGYGTTLDVHFYQPGLHTVKLHAVNSSCGDHFKTSDASLQVRVYPKPVAQIQYSHKGLTGHYVADGHYPPGTTFTWTIDNETHIVASPDNNSSIDVSFDTYGKHTVTLTVSHCGFTSTISRTVCVNDISVNVDCCGCAQGSDQF